MDGAVLHAALDKIHPRDNDGLSDFYSGLTESDKEAMDVYGVEKKKEEQQNRQEPRSKVTPVQQNRVLAINNERLSDRLNQYISAKMNGPEAWKEKTKDKFYQHILLMVEMLDDPLAHNLTVEDLQEKYAGRISKIPMRMSHNKKSYFNGEIRKPIDEIMSIADKSKAKRISKSTALDYVSRAKGFLSWCAERKYVTSNINIALSDFKKVKKTKKIKVPSFTKEEQKALFESNSYINGDLMKKPFRHWVPLVALFTGARLGEICQLHTEDIFYDKENGVWVMDINEGGTRTLKTTSSIREVPIPLALERLGFIKFFKEIKRRKEKRLFPELKPDKKGNWGRSVSRWFNEQYIPECGIDKTNKDERKSFHCLRHTMINAGKQQSLKRNVIMELTGHNPNDIHGEYEEDFSIKIKKKIINKIKFDIDFNLIKKWK